VLVSGSLSEYMLKLLQDRGLLSSRGTSSERDIARQIKEQYSSIPASSTISSTIGLCTVDMVSIDCAFVLLHVNSFLYYFLN
jgi:hypothetical protein